MTIRNKWRGKLVRIRTDHLRHLRNVIAALDERLTREYERRDTERQVLQARYDTLNAAYHALVNALRRE